MQTIAVMNERRRRRRAEVSFWRAGGWLGGRPFGEDRVSESSEPTSKRAKLLVPGDREKRQLDFSQYSEKKNTSLAASSGSSSRSKKKKPRPTPVESAFADNQ